MSQNLLPLLHPKLLRSCSGCFLNGSIGFPALMQWSRIRWRWLRRQVALWLTLAIAPLQWLMSSGGQRTQANIRWMRAIGTIDFVSVYKFLDDLLW